MAHDLFLVDAGYLCFCHVEQIRSGKWHGWVNFERKHDHDLHLARIPGMRHAVAGTYDSHLDAVLACATYARSVVEQGEVGL